MKRLLVFVFAVALLGSCGNENNNEISNENNSFSYFGNYQIVYTRIGHKLELLEDSTFTYKYFLEGKEKFVFNGTFDVINVSHKEINAFGDITNEKKYEFLVLNNNKFTTYCERLYSKVDLNYFLNPNSNDYVKSLNGKESRMPILAGNDYEKSFESKGHLIFKRYGNDIGTHSLGGIDSWNYFSSPEILKKI